MGQWLGVFCGRPVELGQCLGLVSGPLSLWVFGAERLPLGQQEGAGETVCDLISEHLHGPAGRD